MKTSQCSEEKIIYFNPFVILSYVQTLLCLNYFGLILPELGTGIELQTRVTRNCSTTGTL
jgi:hypothetical protein